jgi:NAD(P)-dependent dehydrogenase (short-subunit alcohol dehydrogenase family)
MHLNFKNKVAIITGAGGGLGKAYAFELSRRGAKIVVNDLGSSVDGSGFSLDPSREVVDAIMASGGDAVADNNNIAEEDGAKRIVQKALHNYGTVDILINNAGIIRDKSFSKMGLDEFDQILKVHLYGTFFVTREAFSAMKKNQYGRIVVTTSISGLYGNFGQVNYAAAKLGVVGLMNALKEESQKYNIMINAISPVADTRISAGSLPSDQTRIIKADYVSPAVTYLCSEECRTSGDIINACGRYYSKSQIVESQGYYFDEGREITAEMIAEEYNSITKMGTTRVHHNITEALKHMLNQNIMPV